MWTITSATRKVRSAIRGLLHRDEAERDLNDEIRLHIELETARHVSEGVDPAEARRRALVAFGGVEVVREAHRDGRGMRWFEELVSDARHALRVLRRSPTHAVTAIVTLALGIGATTAIVAVVNQVIIRPLPFVAPNRLVMLWEENPDRAWKLQELAPANYLDLQEKVGAFESAAGWLDFVTNTTLTGNGEPKLLTNVSATGGLFTTLGVKPQLGRAFVEAETWENGTHTVLLSHRAWRTQFGSRADIVGKTIQLDGEGYEVIGVLPASFRLPGYDPDVWTPTAFPPANRTKVFFRRAHYMRAVARLRPGVSQERANAEVKAVMARLEKDFPVTNTHMGGGVSDLHTFLIGDSRRPLMLLLSAVGVLLLIACANVSNLQLVHATSRQREVALRLALGAKRGRLVRQALTASLVLALVGGAAGVLTGWLAVRVLASLMPSGMLPPGALALDSMTVLLIVATTVVCGLLFGAAPAVWQAHRPPTEMLRDGGRQGTVGRRMQTWMHVMVVSEVALAVVLTLGAGLLTRSFWQLQQVDPGFRADGVMTMSYVLPGSRYDSARKVMAFQSELIKRAGALPGVLVAGMVSNLPATQFSWSSDFSVQGRTGEMPISNVVHREASPDYQAVMGIKRLRGRLFTDADGADAPLVVLINDELARLYFPNEDPVGKRITFDRIPDSTSFWRTIVGVVASERQGDLATDARPEFFAPLAQDRRSGATLVVRMASNPASISTSLRRLVSELDPQLAISDMRTMEAVRSKSIGRERFLTAILLVFAIVGLVLALVGVYGVISQLARARLREMGIRLALGAPQRGIQWLVVRRGLALAGMGVIIGVGAAAAGTGALAALLYEVKPLDGLTFATVPLLLVACAAIASWLPARRASLVDPTVTLRAE